MANIINEYDSRYIFNHWKPKKTAQPDAGDTLTDKIGEFGAIIIIAIVTIIVIVTIL